MVQCEDRRVNRGDVDKVIRIVAGTNPGFIVKVMWTGIVTFPNGNSAAMFRIEQIEPPHPEDVPIRLSIHNWTVVEVEG
jgi:hypothetical protein